MLLALTAPGGNRSALPPCSRTLPQAELFHRAIVARVARGQQVHCPELTGRDEQGRPLQDCHRHAHILPLDLDGDGRLDHLVVHAPMGLGEAAQRAIGGLRRAWTPGGRGELQLALVGTGNLETLRSLAAPLNRQIERLLGPPEGACVWVSATPFVPPRFLKRRGANALLGQINGELASRALPPVDQLEELRGPRRSTFPAGLRARSSAQQRAAADRCRFCRSTAILPAGSWPAHARLRIALRGRDVLRG